MENRNLERDFLDRESIMTEYKSYGRNILYRLLPVEDGEVYHNRLIILLWKPAFTCPEIFERFYSQGQWDFKAAVRGHWVTDEDEGVNAFVYCPVETSKYYSKLLNREFASPPCQICASGGRASVRYLFQVFDYQKAIGEKPLDEGEDRPLIQVMSAPETIYKQLYSKYRIGYEFWDTKVIRITKDTRKGKKFSEYIVEIEPRDPEVISNQNLLEYLRDPNNHVNPVPDVIRMSVPENSIPQVAERTSAVSEKVEVSEHVGISSPERRITTPAPDLRKGGMRW